MEELRQNYQLLFENISELMSQRYKMLGILGLYIEDLEQETPIDAVLYYVFKTKSTCPQMWSNLNHKISPQIWNKNV